MVERETEATNFYVQKGAVSSCDVQKELPCANKILVYLEHRNTVTPPVKYAVYLSNHFQTEISQGTAYVAKILQVL